MSIAIGTGLRPAQRIDSNGQAHVDHRAVMQLALPLMANSSIQIVLNLTDMWFIGHISTEALAGVAAVQWLVLVVVLVFGGVASAVQPLAAQYYGARRRARASQAAWTALWATGLLAPGLLLIAGASHLILAPFGLGAHIEQLADAFWEPRIAGSVFGIAVWAMLGFFNGIGHPGVTFLISLVTATANVIGNFVLVFGMQRGVSGCAWATTIAQALGLVLCVAVFLGGRYRREFKSRLTWHLHLRQLRQQLALGLPTGLLPAADLLGLSIFQMMQVRLGLVDGAATQLAMIMTSIAYMPGFGIALSATTLVGQSIGANDRAWAMCVGSHVILLTALFMGGVGVLLAAVGPLLLPWFLAANDPDAAAVVALGTRLLWLAAVYQVFDGLNMGSAMSLRGAGDVTVPAGLVIPVSWFVFVPLAHAFTFAPGEGWVSFLPQFGWGAVGGWAALVVYVLLLGTALYLRWCSRAWQKIRL